MKNITHQLTHNASGKLLNLTLHDKTLISEAGKPDKLKTSEKVFSSDEDALKNFYKKEWEALKKGYVLYNETAEKGQPFLHKFIGGGYTGAMAFAQTSKGIFVNRDNLPGESFDSAIHLMTTSGNISKTIQLPKPLAWNIEYREITNSLIMDIDHYIYEFDIENETFKNIGSEKRKADSLISVSNENTAFATLNQLTIIDNENKVLYKTDYETELVNGSLPFCGKLSNDGKLLAFHNKVGEIQIIDIIAKTVKNKIVGDFKMIGQFEFANNNNLLIVREEYGNWGMKYFDLSANEEIKMKEIEIPGYTKDVNAFCFNADQTKLVLQQRANAHVFDFVNKNLLHSFKIEHLVKSCAIKFVGEKLGVRTDYGCFSLYSV